MEVVVLGGDGTPLERGEALKLPWREARRHAHAAVLIDMIAQVPTCCLWRGLPDLPKGLKLAKAAAVLEQIERRPGLVWARSVAGSGPGRRACRTSRA
jgi:hypothetical protein